MLFAVTTKWRKCPSLSAKIVAQKPDGKEMPTSPPGQAEASALVVCAADWWPVQNVRTPSRLAADVVRANLIRLSFRMMKLFPPSFMRLDCGPRFLERDDR